MSIESPRPERKSKSYRRNALALGLVAGVAVGIAVEREETVRTPVEVKPSTTVSPETYTALDSNGAAVNDPRETIIIERPQPKRVESDWLEPISPVTCVVPDLTLSSSPTEREVAAVSEIDMGLSIQEYIGIKRSLDTAASMDEVRSIVQKVYSQFDIEVTFNVPEENLVVEPVRTIPSPYEASIPEYRDFASKMSNQLSALLYMPRQMVELPKTVNIIDGGILNYIKDGFNEPISGMYKTDGSRRVVLSSAAGKRILVHEWAHALHFTACQNASGLFVDQEMKAAFDAALETLKSDAAPGESKETKERRKEQMVKDIARMRDEKGFPSEYSLMNSIELMAELTEHLLLDGQSNTYDGAASPQAIKLDEMAAERMQIALPELDIREYLAVKTHYPKGAPLQELLERHVSPLDMTYESAADIKNGTVLTPAVDIISRGATRVEHLYASIEKIKKMTEGIYGGAYKMSFRKPAEPTVQEQLEDASLTYLQKAVRRDGITAHYEIREFEDHLVIIGAYEKDGISEEAPVVRRTSFVKNK